MTALPAHRATWSTTLPCDWHALSMATPKAARTLIDANEANSSTVPRPSSHPAEHPSTRQVCRCTQPRLEKLSRASLDWTAAVAREAVEDQTRERES